MPVSNIGPTKILPFLYLGSQKDALSEDITQVRVAGVSQLGLSSQWLLATSDFNVNFNSLMCLKINLLFTCNY